MSKTATAVVLDNEAVQALLDPSHPKHRRALAVVEAAQVRSRRTGSLPLVVPTSVRVEAGWDRRASGAAVLNRLRVRDHALDTAAADRAAQLRADLEVSVPDAHLGIALTDLVGPHAVLTSDVGDVRRLARHMGTPTNVVRL